MLMFFVLLGSRPRAFEGHARLTRYYPYIYRKPLGIQSKMAKGWHASEAIVDVARRGLPT